DQAQRGWNALAEPDRYDLRPAQARRCAQLRLRLILTGLLAREILPQYLRSAQLRRACNDTARAALYAEQQSRVVEQAQYLVQALPGNGIAGQQFSLRL